MIKKIVFFFSIIFSQNFLTFYETLATFKRLYSIFLIFVVHKKILIGKYYVSAFEWSISEHFLMFRTIFRRLWKMVKNRLFPLFACSSTGGRVADLGHFLPQKWPKIPFLGVKMWWKNFWVKLTQKVVNMPTYTFWMSLVSKIFPNEPFLRFWLNL